MCQRLLSCVRTHVRQRVMNLLLCAWARHRAVA